MENEIRKEVLTKEIIKKEIIYNAIKGHIVQLIMLLIVSVISTVWLIEEICNNPIKFDNLNVLLHLWIVIPLIFWYGWFFFELFRFLKRIWIVKNNKLLIITDRLKSFKFMTARYGFDYYTMFFSCERKYILPRGRNYNWSKNCCMKDKEIID
ncbi:MAG: hypothetical protein IKU82_01825, partial [Clostridia bacterium]|nr:hypothetical protein [Clostridia bacterium]